MIGRERLEQLDQLADLAGERRDLARARRARARRTPRAAARPSFGSLLVDHLDQPVGDPLEHRRRPALEVLVADRHALEPRAQPVLAARPRRRRPCRGRPGAPRAPVSSVRRLLVIRFDVARAELIDRLVLAGEHRGGREQHAGGDEVDRDHVERGVVAHRHRAVALEHQVHQRRGRVEALVPARERVAHRALDDRRPHDRRRAPCDRRG